MAHAFALQTISLLISYTTQKYQKQFTSWPIEKICLGISEEIFANLISKLYLNHIKFDKNIKTDIEDMVKLIKENFEKLLDANEWMDPVTKKLAKEKLLAIHTNAVAQPIVFNDEQLEKDHVEVSQLIPSVNN